MKNLMKYIYFVLIQRLLFFAPFKWDLVVLAIFKNEALAITEWIDHYLNEGVEHFLLINNGSTDCSCEILQPYIESGIVTLYNDDTKWAQAELYNKYFRVSKMDKKCRWLIVCDLDEFIYSRKNFRTIKEYLSSLNSAIGLIKIPWKMFGSSGVEKQPCSIIKSFCKRCRYFEKQNPGMKNNSEIFAKYIVNTKCIRELDIHSAEINPKYAIVDSSGKLHEKDDGCFIAISECDLEKSVLHLNHYALQSKEWFLQVKCTRGAADNANFENVRDLSYFNQFDSHCNEIVDKELYEKSINYLCRV